MFSLANALKELDHEVEFWGMYDEDNSVDDTYNTFVRNIKLNGKKPMVNYINEAFNLIYSFKNDQYLILFFLITLSLLVAYLIYKLRVPFKNNQYQLLSSLMKIIMLVGVLSMTIFKFN